MASEFNPRGARVTSAHPMNYGTAASPGVSVGPGSKGINVKELQAKLSKLGYAVQITGEYDTATSSAVQAFQTREQLPVSGSFGPVDAHRVMQRLLQLQGQGAVGAIGTAASPTGTWGGDPTSPEAKAYFKARDAAIARGDDPTGPLPMPSHYQMLPTWQKGLMLVGGLAIVGGIIWAFTSKSGAVAGTHTAKKPCPRAPPASAFTAGSVLLPLEQGAAYERRIPF